MFSRQTLRDQVAHAQNPARLRVPAFTVIDALQRTRGATRGELVVGAAVALIAMCESADVPLNDVLVKATRILRDVDGPFTAHIQAIRDYARNELRRGV